LVVEGSVVVVSVVDLRLFLRSEGVEVFPVILERLKGNSW
jgi:hypothetical protein